MRIGTKIKSLILLFVAFCLSVVFGVVSFGDVKRVSGASANIVSTELNVAGASLRYTNTQDKAAARYHVTISDALYENTVAKGKETGILVIPNAVLAGKELNLDTPSAKKGVFSNGDVNNWERNAQGDYEARAFIDNIPTKNYGTKLAVVAYAETSNGAGTFDGDGHKIIGLDESGWTSGKGLIPVLHADGVIKNVAFTQGKLGFCGGFV